MKMTRQSLEAIVYAIACSALLGCGPGPVEEEETWMLGVFSNGGVPCSPFQSVVWRYEIYEDGRIDISSVEPGYERTWHARWEQRSPGRIRLTPDYDDPGHPDPHPIGPGYVWEITRSHECAPWGGDYLITHPVESVRIEDGYRSPRGSMAPGLLCITYDESHCFAPDAYVYWCDGPPQECQ